MPFSTKSKISFPSINQGSIVIVEQKDGKIRGKSQPIDASPMPFDLEVAEIPGGSEIFEVRWKDSVISEKPLSLSAANKFAIGWARKNLSKSRNYSSANFIALAIFVVVAVIFLFAPLPSPQAVTPSNAVLEPRNSTLSLHGSLTKMTERKLTDQQLYHVKQAAQMLGVPLRDASPSSQPLYVIADPRCPHCQTLEPELYNLPANIQPIVLPTPILGDLSFHRVSEIYSGDDSSEWQARWKKLLADPNQTLNINPDEHGILRSKMTQALFFALDFESTPTLISQDGRIVTGSRSSDQITQWIEE